MLDQAASFGRSALDACDAALQWLVGSSRGSTFAVSRWLFLRALGLIFIIAFISLWVQVKGLIGSQGILPAQDLLRSAQMQLGPERYRLLPTLFWVNASDTALNIACALGTAAALALVADIAPTAMLIVLWALYLSLTVVGRDFLAFQWDVLLLEPLCWRSSSPRGTCSRLGRVPRCPRSGWFSCGGCYSASASPRGWSS